MRSSRYGGFGAFCRGCFAADCLPLFSTCVSYEKGKEKIYTFFFHIGNSVSIVSIAGGDFSSLSMPDLNR